MKNTFSIEFKIIFAAALAMLTIATIAVLGQVFGRDTETVKFVYNSSSETVENGVNNSEIFVRDVNSK